jgi:hypothetical protein
VKGKAFKSIVLVVSIVLVIAGGANASSPEEDTPIPPGPQTELPDYIGQPAVAKPLPNSGVPQNPNFAPNPFAIGHSDSWMSDTADLAGPLGRNPVVSSTSLAGIERDSWIASGGNMAFDSHGRPVVFLFGIDWASVALLDPDTLDVVSSYPLKATPGFTGEGAQKIPSSAWSIYAYLDNRDQIHIVSEGRKILTLAETGSPDHPVLEQVGEVYDLTPLLGQTGDRITALNVDFQGRFWINLATAAKIYLLNPKTAQAPYLDPPLPSVSLDIDEDGDEFTRNGLALTREGAAYVVTTEAMYRVDADADDNLSIVWQEPYDSIGVVRPGQYELGSGTTPTVLGEGKYVAITDNAEQLQVVVYRTDEQLDPGEERKVCEVPVFDFPGGGAGAGSNSLLGLRNSIIAQNTADYLFDWKKGQLKTPGKPGMERIDIDPDGSGCTKVWVNTEVHTNMVLRVSTRNGLIYNQDRKYDATNKVYAVYWVALDFRTGEVVWEKLAGTFDPKGLAMFDNFWAPYGLGPNGALYGANYGGVTMLRDGP